MSTTQRENVLRWLPTLITIVINLIFVGYVYGKMEQRIVPIEKHVDAAQVSFVSRAEWTVSRQSRDREISDLNTRLERIENKLDRALERQREQD